jgi:hypothetical protein
MIITAGINNNIPPLPPLLWVQVSTGRGGQHSLWIHLSEQVRESLGIPLSPIGFSRMGEVIVNIPGVERERGGGGCRLSVRMT